LSLFLLVKTAHILSSVVLVGTGFGSAFYLFFANRTLVVRADWWFTTPTIIAQPLTGCYLMRQSGLPWTTPWIDLALALFTAAGACWLPVVWLQIRMADMAADAQSKRGTLPARYWRYAKAWERLGYLAFAAMVAIYFLMVFKPDP